MLWTIYILPINNYHLHACSWYRTASMRKVFSQLYELLLMMKVVIQWKRRNTFLSIIIQTLREGVFMCTYLCRILIVAKK